MVVAVALANSSVSHCDDKFLTCNYSGGTVIWKEPTDPASSMSRSPVRSAQC
nr:MAG TPA: hypothetical protein [Caudoviricetes sp.]